MNCPICGKPIPSGSMFCPACGEKAPVPEAKPDDVIARKLKLLFITPVIIVCLLAVTVLSPWQLLAAEELSDLSGIFEDEIRSSTLDQDLSPDQTYNYATGTYINSGSQYFFAHENDFIDALYDEAYIEPSEVNDSAKTFLVMMGLCGIMVAVGLWLVFISAQRTDTLLVNTAGFTTARVGIWGSMVFLALMILVLFFQIADINSALSAFQEYSRLKTVVSNLCSGYTWMLILVGVVGIWYGVLLQSQLRRLAESCNTSVPEEISYVAPVLCFVIGAVLLLMGLIRGQFMMYLLPASVQIILGVSLRYLRDRLKALSSERYELLARSHKSRIIKPK